MTARLLVTLAFVSLAITGLKAQARDSDLSIQFGGFDLTLGMVQEDVLRKLSSVYTLTVSDDVEGMWVVVSKPSDVIGHVAFRNGKLTFVSKQWLKGPNSGKVDVSAIGEALHSAIQAATRSRGFCIVNSGVEPTQGRVTGGSQTNIYCGHHHVVIWVTELAGVVTTDGTGPISFLEITERLE